MYSAHGVPFLACSLSVTLHACGSSGVIIINLLGMLSKTARINKVVHHLQSQPKKLTDTSGVRRNFSWGGVSFNGIG